MIALILFLIFNITSWFWFPIWESIIHAYFGVIGLFGSQVSIFIYSKFRDNQRRLVHIVDEKPEDVYQMIYNISDKFEYTSQRGDFLDGELFYWKNTELIEIRKGHVQFFVEISGEGPKTTKIILERIDKINMESIYLFALELNKIIDK